jgi:hypothetical protein
MSGRCRSRALNERVSKTLEADRLQVADHRKIEGEYDGA